MSMIKSVFSNNVLSVDDETVSIEGLFLEANKINTECAELEFGIESLDVVMDQLDSLSASVESYGNDSNCKALLKTQAIDLMAPLGMPASNVGQPSVEGIKSWAQNIWKTIMDAFKKIWHKMKDWYLKMFSGAARMVKAAEKLRDAASKATGTADEKKLEVGSTFKALAIAKSDKTVDLTNVVELATRTVDSGKVSEKTLSDAIIAYLDSGKVENDEIIFSVNLVGANNNFSDYMKINAYAAGNGTINADSSVKAEDGYQVSVATALPGNKAVFRKFSEGAAITKSKITFGTYNTKLKLEDGSFDSLESGGIEDLADKVITIAQQVVDYQKSFKDTDKYRADVDKAVTTFNKMVDSEDALKNKDVVRAAQKVANLGLHRLDHPRQEIISYLLSTCSATLTFGSKCLSNLKA